MSRILADKSSAPDEARIQLGLIRNPLDVALRYAQRGWRVIPLHSARGGECTCGITSCPSFAKHPRTKHGAKDATSDETAIRTWWREWPDANIGIATGAASRLIVLDVDGDKGAASLGHLEGHHGPLPRTHEVITGKGRHFYFRYPKEGPIRNSVGSIGAGLDLRSDGGYVVAPPSVHQNGRPYRWETDAETTLLCDPPHWLLEATRDPDDPTDMDKRDGMPIPEGSRNVTLTKMAGALRRHGNDEPTISAALQAVNKARCAPPLPQREVSQVAKSVMKYEPRLSQRDRLVMLRADAQLWHDADGQNYITFEVDGHRENWPLRSKGARNWFYKRYLETYGGAPSSQAYEDALRSLESEAQFHGQELTSHLRVADHRGRIYLDLCDAEWRSVEISADGWQIVPNPPVRFVRTARMRPLPDPVSGTGIDALRPFLNVQSEPNFRLIVAFLMAAMRPRGPYPVLVLNGEQGAAKSTSARVLRALVDPNTSPIRGAPREERDLVSVARNGWMVCFDNLSGVGNDLADAICRLATGGGLGGRQLYTDHDEAVFEAQRPVVINGIPDLATRGDLGDRSVVITLPQIGGERRRQEKKFWVEFEAARPHILGALLDGLAHAIRNPDAVEPQQLPRMADFAVGSMRAFPAFGWTAADFVDAYDMNDAETVEAIIDADPVAPAILKFINERGNFEGTATELLNELERASQFERSRTWPKNAGQLGGAVRRAAPALRKVRLEVELGRRSSSARKIIIRKVG